MYERRQQKKRQRKTSQKVIDNAILELEVVQLRGLQGMFDENNNDNAVDDTNTR